MNILMKFFIIIVIHKTPIRIAIEKQNIEIIDHLIHNDGIRISARDKVLFLFNEVFQQIL